LIRDKQKWEKYWIKIRCSSWKYSFIIFNLNCKRPEAFIFSLYYFLLFSLCLHIWTVEYLSLRHEKTSANIFSMEALVLMLNIFWKFSTSAIRMKYWKRWQWLKISFFAILSLLGKNSSEWLWLWGGKAWSRVSIYLFHLTKQKPNLLIICIIHAGVIHYKPTRGWMVEILFLLARPWQHARSSWVGGDKEKKNTNKTTSLWSSLILEAYIKFLSTKNQVMRSGLAHFLSFSNGASLW